MRAELLKWSLLLAVSFFIHKALTVTLLRLNDVEVNLNVTIGVELHTDSYVVSFFMLISLYIAYVSRYSKFDSNGPNFWIVTVRRILNSFFSPKIPIFQNYVFFMKVQCSLIFKYLENILNFSAF